MVPVWELVGAELARGEQRLEEVAVRDERWMAVVAENDVEPLAARPTFQQSC